MKRTTKKMMKVLEEKFQTRLDDVVIIDHEKAYQCKAYDNWNDVQHLEEEEFFKVWKITNEWIEIEWTGDKPNGEHNELMLIIHDHGDSIVDDWFGRWDEINEEANVFTEPYNSWKMGVYEE